ncbi:hypothetical protein GE061_002175 [Apolygus lucorum]|uniref:Mediator of RNA polymerase II transcription subunit 20 n=1 Tax=Apolygus lucorum TaxID=248454 RepID=A0A8S9X3Z0_APOLU|nr:hypothetical protein GE061_002175 [Apolygus lucorum]
MIYVDVWYKQKLLNGQQLWSYSSFILVNDRGSLIFDFSICHHGGPQTIEFLTKRVSALGAVQSGQFLVNCDTYVSTPSLPPQRTVHVVHNSEHPSSVFAILESGQKTIPLVADRLFDLLMLKIKNIYTKKQPTIESKGPRFELADFCIKLGSVTISQNFKGVLVEVEYKPCVVPAYCQGLMREFLQGFLGSCFIKNSRCNG